MNTDIDELIEDLKSRRGDNTSVEVKSARGGLPQSLTETLSAFANLPGGGTVILGLDENAGFAPVGLPDPQSLKQGLANKARAYTPPIQLTVEDAVVAGSQIIVARVAECDPSNKPCRVTASGTAYLRGYDGDFELSDLEEQAFLVQRGSPQFDRRPVNGSSEADLDRELVTEWLRTVRERDPTGLGRFDDDDELLRRGGVISADGALTTAGLLALGAYPQQWFPRYVIHLASSRTPRSASGVRAENVTTLSGPIPILLAGSLAWAETVFSSTVVGMPSGGVRDDTEYPLAAFREIISNALVHRDLADWSAGLAIEVRLTHDRLVVSNPGGLYGITVDRLGRDAVTSARNPLLLTICQYVRSTGERERVVEALASGIPTITAALEAAGLPPAQFLDAGIRFTVILRREATKASSPIQGRTAVAIWGLLEQGPLTVEEIADETGLEPPNIRRVLRSLRRRGLIEWIRGDGNRLRYRRRL